MNRSVFRTAGLVGVAVAMVASAASAWAQSGGSSSIPTPASSADSGSRAVIAITVPTATDVQTIAIGAAQAVNQGGTVCGMEQFVFQGSPVPKPPTAAKFSCNNQYVEYVFNTWRSPCPSGWKGNTVITDYNEDTNEWGHSNGVTYARGYAFCKKD